MHQVSAVSAEHDTAQQFAFVRALLKIVPLQDTKNSKRTRASNKHIHFERHVSK